MAPTKESLWTKGLPFGLVVLGCVIVAAWWFVSSGTRLKERIPGEDRADTGAGSVGGTGKWEGKLLKGNGVAPTNFSGVWPWFRGPDLNAISSEKVPLAKSWPENGPKVLWKTEVGEGFAAAAIWKGRVFFIDYDQKAQADALRCLSLADGQEIWRYSYPSIVKSSHGKSRTIPAVTDKWVISLGPKCQVLCVDPQSGDFRWQMNLVR